MANNEGRPGYRSPTAKREKYSWRTTAAQWDSLCKHRFEGEEFQPLMNRLLRRLARCTEEGAAPVGYRFIPNHEPKEGVKSFYADLRVAQLIADYDQGATQKTIDYLVGWAVLLPPVGAMENADEAMGLLRQFRAQRVKVEDVKDLLTEYCTDANARIWLCELAERGKLRLVQAKGGIRLGEGRQKSYYYLEVL